LGFLVKLQDLNFFFHLCLCAGVCFGDLLISEKSAMAGGCEERERRMMMMESVVCPKPRKLLLLNPSLCEQIRPLRLSVKYVFLFDPIIVPFSLEHVFFFPLLWKVLVLFCLVFFYAVTMRRWQIQKLGQSCLT